MFFPIGSNLINTNLKDNFSKNTKTGKKAYVDVITKTQNKNINLDPVRELQSQVDEKTAAAFETVNFLLGFDGTGVFAQELVDEIIKSIAKLFDILNPKLKNLNL